MKKFILSAIVTLFIAVSSFAAETNKVNSQVAFAFQSEFRGAKNVEWTHTTGYIKASFDYANKKMEAFYDLRGNSIGVSSNISIDDLPTNAKRCFAKKYAGYTVKEAIQFETTDEMAYFVSAENETQSVVIKVADNGTVSVFKNVRK